MAQWYLNVPGEPNVVVNVPPGGIDPEGYGMLEPFRIGKRRTISGTRGKTRGARVDRTRKS